MKQKDAMRDRILRGWPFTPEEQKKIIAYCATDMDALRLLLARMLPEIDLAVALHHGEFAAAAALMEHRGIPMDMEKLSLLQDEKTWSAVRDAMVPALDARCRVYVRNAAGDWTCSEQRFAAMLEREGITGWPRLESGKLNMKEKTIKDMAKGRPVLEPFRQLRYTRNKMRKVKLAVGRDGRNRTVLWPFQAKTSRTQPKASQWIFSPAVWLRSLIKPTPEMAVAHIDYACAEFMIGAVLSDGHLGPVNNMRDLYLSGDPYLTFAKRVGAVPNDCTKHTPGIGTVRQKYKVFLLAVMFGMSDRTLASLLGVSEVEAHVMLAQHREMFAQYWRWSDDWVQHSLQTGMMRSAMGWTCAVGLEESKERTIRNWPIQTACADMLRIACIMWRTRRGIRILAPNSSTSVLIEAPPERIEADTKSMQDIMRRASRIVLGGGHELRTDAETIRYPNRYTDDRGTEMWNEVTDKLAAYLEQRKREVA